MDVAISAEALGFVYPDGTRALTSVDLIIGPGERVAIVGQNGSGKSTLIRHFNGLLRASEGRVLVAGEPVGRRHVADLARLVGVAFQNPDRQIFARSVRAEVGFGARHVGVGSGRLGERTEAALLAVELEAAGAENPFDLGFSRRKLLAIASVLAMETPVVVLDEPTTGQDARGVERLRSVIDQLAAAGRTVIAVSHDMRFVAENFARVVVMLAGTIILDGTPAEVFAEANWPALAATYLDAPYPARLGAKLGLGSTPTDFALVEALRTRPRG
jgi:energy-coupling factor transport system ATP-binding protein